MSLTFKVLDGTRKSGKTLCTSCAHSARRLGQNNEDEIFCASWSFRSDSGVNPVLFKVSDCTEYRPFNQQSREDMEKIAWIVTARKKGSPGFVKTADAETASQDPNKLIIEIKPPKPSEDD